MLEFEKKFLLSRSEYAHLLKEAPASATVRQTNYYFDTEELLLDRRGITCRIREKDGKYLATIKEHSASGGSLERSEYAFGEWDTHFFDGLGVSLMGALITDRTTLFKDARCEIVLDKNTYLGTTDYELEAEYLPNEEAYADALLSAIATRISLGFAGLTPAAFLARCGKGRSKSRRFFDRLAERKGESV